MRFVSFRILKGGILETRWLQTGLILAFLFQEIHVCHGSEYNQGGG